MSNPAKKTLLAHLKEMRNPPEGCKARPEKDDIFTWRALIAGPEGTIWEGGLFRLTMKIPDNYPQYPPKVKFDTPVFHPNIYTNGDICLDLLQSQWSPQNTIASILISIQSLLNDPNPSSPANKEAAGLLTNNKAEYEKKVRECVANSMSYLE